MSLRVGGRHKAAASKTASGIGHMVTSGATKALSVTVLAAALVLPSSQLRLEMKNWRGHGVPAVVNLALPADFSARPLSPPAEPAPEDYFRLASLELFAAAPGARPSATPPYLDPFTIAATLDTFDGPPVIAPVANGETMALRSDVPLPRSQIPLLSETIWQLVGPDGETLPDYFDGEGDWETGGTRNARTRFQIRGLRNGDYTARLSHRLPQWLDAVVTSEIPFTVYQSVGIDQLWITDIPQGVIDKQAILAGQTAHLYMGYHTEPNVSEVLVNLSARNQDGIVLGDQEQRIEHGANPFQRVNLIIDRRLLHIGDTITFSATITGPDGHPQQATTTFPVLGHPVAVTAPPSVKSREWGEFSIFVPPYFIPPLKIDLRAPHLDIKRTGREVLTGTLTGSVQVVEEVRSLWVQVTDSEDRVGVAEALVIVAPPDEPDVVQVAMTGDTTEPGPEPVDVGIRPQPVADKADHTGATVTPKIEPIAEGTTKPTVTAEAPTAAPSFPQASTGAPGDQATLDQEVLEKTRGAGIQLAPKKAYEKSKKPLAPKEEQVSDLPKPEPFELTLPSNTAFPDPKSDAVELPSEPVLETNHEATSAFPAVDFGANTGNAPAQSVTAKPPPSKPTSGDKAGDDADYDAGTCHRTFDQFRKAVVTRNKAGRSMKNYNDGFIHRVRTIIQDAEDAKSADRFAQFNRLWTSLSGGKDCSFFTFSVKDHPVAHELKYQAAEVLKECRLYEEAAAAVLSGRFLLENKNCLTQAGVPRDGVLEPAPDPEGEDATVSTAEAGR